MIKADVPQDVTEYKEQFFLGMTGRQLVCVALMIAKVTDFYFGNQRRKISYLPDETEIHNKVREIALSSAEAERKAELKQEKQKRKSERKGRKKKCPKQ